MMTTLPLLLLLAADVHVRSVEGCTDPAAVQAVLDESAPVDVAEVVTVTVRAHDDPAEPFRLLVTAALIGTPPLARETTLRAVECADVPALVAVWLSAHRRALPEPDEPPSANPATTETTTTAPPAAAPRAVAQTPAQQPWSLVHGPPPFVGLSLSLSGGLSNHGGRAAFDLGYDVWGPLDVIAAADVSSPGEDPENVGLHAGAAVSTDVANLRLSLRALLGAGVATPQNAAATAAAIAAACPPGADGADGDVVAGAHRARSTPFFGPTVAVRARYTWFFVEGGTTWRFGVDDAPGLYAAFGVTLLGG